MGHLLLPTDTSKKDFTLSSSKMNVASFILLSFLISSTIGLNEDMIETGYLQDPASVGQLPTEFGEDIVDMDHGYTNDDTMEEQQEELDDERSIEDDLEWMDS